MSDNHRRKVVLALPEIILWKTFSARLPARCHNLAGRNPMAYLAPWEELAQHLRIHGHPGELLTSKWSAGACLPDPRPAGQRSSE